MGFSMLMFPVVILMGIPAGIGFLTVAVRLFHILSKNFKKETSFVVTLCAMAALLSAFSAPYWFIGRAGWLILTGLYVFFVAMGGRHTFRIIKFIHRELDDDPTNDVPMDDLSLKSDKDKQGK